MIKSSIEIYKNVDLRSLTLKIFGLGNKVIKNKGN